MLTCFIYQMDMFVIAAQDHFSFFCFGNVSFLVTTFGVVSQPALLVHSSPTHSLPQCLIPSKSYTTLIIVSFVSRPLLFIYSFIFFWWRWDIVDDCFILCFILCSVSWWTTADTAWGMPHNNLALHIFSIFFHYMFWMLTNKSTERSMHNCDHG